MSLFYIKRHQSLLVRSDHVNHDHINSTLKSVLTVAQCMKLTDCRHLELVQELNLGLVQPLNLGPDLHKTSPSPLQLTAHQLLHKSQAAGGGQGQYDDSLYCMMLCKAQYCYSKSSVHPSVTVRYRDHIGWNSSKIISPLVSLGSLLSADPNITDLLQGEHLKILAGIGVGHRKVAFGVQSSNISEIGTTCAFD